MNIETLTTQVGETTGTPSTGTASTGTPSPQTPAFKDPVPAANPLRLAAKERLALLNQLAILLDSGVQIPAALQSMRVECRQPRVAAVLRRLEAEVQSGRPLSEAIGALPKAFGDVVFQMVRAGERSGRMAEVLIRTTEMLEADALLRSRLRSAMLYPCVMILLTTGVVAFLLVAIVPKFERLFQSRAAALPTPTRWLLALGEITSTHGLWLFPAVFVFLAAVLLYLRTSAGRRYLDAILLKLPVVGGIYRTSILSRCARTLGLLVKSGVPAHVALEHARDVASSPTYVDFWAAARLHVVNGGTLTEAVRGNALVPHTFQQVVAAGEATAHLDDTMLKTADQYARELERRIRDLVTLVEPAMVVAMGVVVGFIALSIMLPIFQLSRA